MAEDEVRLPDTGNLIVSSSPHYHDTQNVPRIMLTVIAALVPACVMGVVYFGVRAVCVLVVCSVSCMVFEALFCRLLERPVSVRDCSALLTGLLLGMNLSALTPWWVCVIGALLAIGLGKMIYGGLGYNPFNPAFPSAMTTWVRPEPGRFLCQAVTTATPLGELQTNHVVGQEYLNYFLGNVGGCIGETSAVALLVGGLVLIALKLVRWQVPVCFICTVALFAGSTYLIWPETCAPPVFHILTGGLMLGAFFMATDMVTSPMSASGAVIFAIGCGVLTSVIRIWGSYPEGVSFSILIMNALTPLIDRYTSRRPFGAVKKQETAA